MPINHQPEAVQLVTVPNTKVAVLEHCGDPKLIGESVRQFIAWRRQNNLPPKIGNTFNIIYNNPAGTAAADYRFDLCVATELDVVENEFGVVGKIIPAGKCAVLRHVGTDENIGDRVMYLYAEWLPQSNEELRDFPLYFQRISFPPAVPETEAVTDIFLPLK
jgi:AraC family transcriptional regulator